MRSDIVVIKLGGASLQNENVLSEVIHTIKEYRKYDYDVVLVHGGGPAINAELTKRDIKWEFINGQRKTTPEMIDVIEEVLFKKINAEIIENFSAAEIPAAALCGSEDNLLFCKQANPELGLVGSVMSVNTDKILRYLKPEKNYVPVISPVGVGASGEKYNINADWAATKIASALKAKKLIFLTDQKGILDSQKELIKAADSAKLKSFLDDQTVTGGMYTKVLTMVDALENGVSQVRVMHCSQTNMGLWSDNVGTMCEVTCSL